MARDLEKLKETLWEQFDKAVERQQRYSDQDYSSTSYPNNNAITNRNAMANIANAIANIEREQREQRKEKTDAESMTLPGKKLSAG